MLRWINAYPPFADQLSASQPAYGLLEMVCTVSKTSVFAFGLAVSILSVAAARAPVEVERGQAYAERHCATCHAVGREGASPYAPAPPFRTLQERYAVEMLAEALAEGIVVGHTGRRQMPAFRLEPAEIDDLIAYMKSLESF